MSTTLPPLDETRHAGLACMAGDVALIVSQKATELARLVLAIPAETPKGHSDIVKNAGTYTVELLTYLHLIERWLGRDLSDEVEKRLVKVPSLREFALQSDKLAHMAKDFTGKNLRRR